MHHAVPSDTALTACGCRQSHYHITIMKYPVVLIESEEGFAVGCPTIPGCWSQGATREEALINIQEAMREVLEVKQELEWQQWRDEGLSVETTSVDLAYA